MEPEYKPLPKKSRKYQAYFTIEQLDKEMSEVVAWENLYPEPVIYNAIMYANEYRN